MLAQMVLGQLPPDVTTTILQVTKAIAGEIKKTNTQQPTINSSIPYQSSPTHESTNHEQLHRRIYLSHPQTGRQARGSLEAPGQSI